MCINKRNFSSIGLQALPPTHTAMTEFDKIKFIAEIQPHKSGWGTKIARVSVVISLLAAPQGIWIEPGAPTCSVKGQALLVGTALHLNSYYIT